MVKIALCITTNFRSIAPANCNLFMPTLDYYNNTVLYIVF